MENVIKPPFGDYIVKTILPIAMSAPGNFEISKYEEIAHLHGLPSKSRAAQVSSLRSSQ
jgi:hypothetical protein